MYYHSVKKKELNCFCCIGDINKNFPRGLLEHPVNKTKRVNGEFDFATNSKYKVDIIQQNQTKYLNL